MPKPTHAKRELTDKFIKAQTATGKLERFPDLLPNFYFYLYPDGAKSFVVLGRRRGAANATTVTLGRYPRITLKEARERARDIRAMLQAGKTPKQLQQERQREQQECQRVEEAQRGNVFGAIAEEFIKKYLWPHLPSAKRQEAPLL
jgi:hypothetical protein